MRKTLVQLLGMSAAVALFTSAAQAGGFATARFGGEHGHPTSDHPTSIYYNPAGLALGEGTRVFVEGLAIYRNASYERPPEAIGTIIDGDGLGTPQDAVTANSGKATVSNFLASPFLGVASDLGVKNLGVGFAFYAPFGGQAIWDKNDEYLDSEAYPGAEDGVQRWATMEGTIRELYLSAAASYRLPGPRLSFGASFNVIQESLDTLRARNASGTDDLVGAGGALVEGRSLVDVSGITFSAALGVIWEATDKLRFGASYQSQPGFGETEQEGELHFKFGNTPADVSKIKFLQELPDITRIGATFNPNNKMEFRFAADYTRWSVFKNQCLIDAENPDANCVLDENGGATPETEGVVVNIRRDWNDTYGVRAGMSYWLDPKKELVAGVSYDSAAVPDETIDPALMDMDKIVSTLGGRFTLAANMLLNLSYTHVFYFERDVPVRDRDAMGVQENFPAPSTVPDHGGTYNQMIGLMNIGLEYRF